MQRKRFLTILILFIKRKQNARNPFIKGILQRFEKGKIRLQKGGFLVEVTGLEPAASSSQNWRATNCATPRN